MERVPGRARHATRLLGMKRLQWRKPDQWHVRSACNRFSVCKMIVEGRIWYVAYRLPYDELGSARLERDATDAERVATIKAMQEICEAAA